MVANATLLVNLAKVATLTGQRTFPALLFLVLFLVPETDLDKLLKGFAQGRNPLFPAKIMNLAGVLRGSVLLVSL